MRAMPIRISSASSQARRATIAIGVALVMGLCGMGAGSAAAAAAASTVPATVAMAASLTSQTSDAARALRRDVTSMLGQYIDAYGNRFSENERAQLLAYRANADRQLAAVVLTTRRLEIATTARAPIADRRARGAAAQSAWRRAKTTADSSFASARTIMEPKLSIVERLTAARDYSTMMGRFDDLGAQIDAASAASASTRTG